MTETNKAAYPPAKLTNDEGGVHKLTGSIDYTAIGVDILYQSAFPALMDMVHVIQGDRSKFAPAKGQVLGRMTSPAYPPPMSYEFDLPIEPSGTYVNVAHDDGQGVQVFRATVGAVINGFPQLVQMDQKSDFHSYLNDPLTGHIEVGNLLVYAPDDQQGFPAGFGEDGVLFTEDDPIVGLPAGYTVVRFNKDGFIFDRSRVAELNVLEEAGDAGFDYREQGLVEAFNNLIDLLAERYSFTELRNIDWEAKRAEFLPDVEAAEAMMAEDAVQGVIAWGVTLHRMAQSIRDAHIAAAFEGPAQIGNMIYEAEQAPIAANVGANTVELNDGRIIVTDVVEGSAASEAGWQFGTQIVSVDGVPAEERLPEVIYNSTVGTEAGQRLRRVNNLLKFPADTNEVTVEAILPGSTGPQSFTLTPAAFPLPDRLASQNLRGKMPIEYDLGSDYGYINWNNFHEPRVRIGVYEDFLAAVNHSNTIKGIIVDMRGNSGGSDTLYFTMASYFFSEENPVSIHWIDQDVYDGEAGGLVRQSADDFLISAPRKELYYSGPIVILSDQNGASSCEFFTQFLQTNGRATVVGQYPSKGAGASITKVYLPGSMFLQFTKARAYFAGTDELNLEAKGVTPDVVVPVNEETERSKIEGGDPVLEKGLEVLREKITQAFVDSLHWQVLPAETLPGYSISIPEGWKQPTPPGLQFQSPDQLYSVFYQVVANDTVEAVLPKLPVKDPASDLVDVHETNGMSWATYHTVANNLFTAFYSVAQIGDDVAMIVTTVLTTQEELGKTAVMFPAIANLTPG